MVNVKMENANVMSITLELSVKRKSVKMIVLILIIKEYVMKKVLNVFAKKDLLVMIVV